MVKLTVSRKTRLERDGGVVRLYGCSWRICKITPTMYKLAKVND